MEVPEQRVASVSKRESKKKEGLTSLRGGGGTKRTIRLCGYRGGWCGNHNAGTTNNCIWAITPVAGNDHQRDQCYKKTNYRLRQRARWVGKGFYPPTFMPAGIFSCS